MVLLGHLISATKTKVAIAPDLKESLLKADRYEADLLKTIDDHIIQHRLQAPAEALVTLKDGYDAEVIQELDLNAANVRSVIWANGYAFDFRFVDLPVFDTDGYPIQDRGVTRYPGLYFVGLPWIHSAKSGLLFGVGDDAAFISAHLAKSIPGTDGTQPKSAKIIASRFGRRVAFGPEEQDKFLSTLWRPSFLHKVST